jgi:hypothetical protein
MQNAKLAFLYLTPLQAAHLGRPWCLRVASDQEMYRDKKFLELYFRGGGGSILCQKFQNPKFQNITKFGGGGGSDQKVS